MNLSNKFQFEHFDLNSSESETESEPEVLKKTKKKPTPPKKQPAMSRQKRKAEMEAVDPKVNASQKVATETPKSIPYIEPKPFYREEFEEKVAIRTPQGKLSVSNPKRKSQNIDPNNLKQNQMDQMLFDMMRENYLKNQPTTSLFPAPAPYNPPPAPVKQQENQGCVIQ